MTENLEMKALEEAFYSKPFFFSYSSLSTLLYSPSLFYDQYIKQQKEDLIGAHIVRGKVIHCLMLNDHTFNDTFVVSPINLPGETTKKVVDEIFILHLAKISKQEKTSPEEVKPLLENYKTEILEILKTIDVHQSLVDDKKADKEGNQRTGDEKRMDKIATPEAISYLEFLGSSQGRTIIDQETLNECKEAAALLKADKRVAKLLVLEQSDFEDALEVYNEKELRIPAEGYAFGLKGILDNYVIDRKNKKIYINDLKTLGKSIQDFPESVEFFRYYLQIYIYVLLVSKTHVPPEEYADWEIIPHFIVIDKYNQIYPFRVTPETLNAYSKLLNEALAEGEWHYNSKRYDLPRAFAEGTVVL